MTKLVHTRTVPDKFDFQISKAKQFSEQFKFSIQALLGKTLLQSSLYFLALLYFQTNSLLFVMLPPTHLLFYLVHMYLISLVLVIFALSSNIVFALVHLLHKLYIYFNLFHTFFVFIDFVLGAIEFFFICLCF